MKLKYLSTAALFVAVASVSIFAQKPEVTISLNESFFDSFLDAVFENASPIEFSIASNEGQTSTPTAVASFAPNPMACRETIQLLRESNGVRTAVRFRDGRIMVPLAFTGSYNPPFVGCVSFSGVADTVIDLEFDQQNQRLLARARVLNVALNGTGGVGGSLIAKLVQGSIDKKVNPIEILTLDKVSFLLPVRNNVNIRMKAASVRHEVVNGALNVIIAYDFVKA
ncbi:MAG: hypothetical protein AB7F88_18755 [Pyrinomonadaceae bacterium]